MPRRSKGTRLWLRPEERNSDGTLRKRAVWVIRDESSKISTGCAATDRAGAERALGEHLANKYQPNRHRGRHPSEILIADVLAKNVALVRAEREVNKVLELTEPFASRLAETGRAPFNRRNMLRLIGQTLLVHHHMSGRVAIEEKPDVLWDRAYLERLYARLEDEYELRERAGALRHKLQVIEETTRALTDIIDTERSALLEILIAIMIGVEILIGFSDLFFRLPK